LTEGFAPLLFGVLMASLQHSRLPGAPYLIAGGFSLAALHMTNRLPEEGQLFEWEKNVLRAEVRAEDVCTALLSWLVCLLAHGKCQDDGYNPRKSLRNDNQGTLIPS